MRKFIFILLLLFVGCASNKDKLKYCTDMAVYLNQSLNYAKTLYSIDSRPDYNKLEENFESLRLNVSNVETIKGWAISDSIKSKLLSSIYSDIDYIVLMKVLDDGVNVKPRDKSRLNLITIHLGNASKQKGEINDLITKATAELK